MRNRIRAEVAPYRLPDVSIGQQLHIEGTATVIGIEDDLVDVTVLGNEQSAFTFGERTIKLLLALTAAETEEEGGPL